MSILLEKLWVMQNNVRNYSKIPQMVDFLKNGGIWSENSLKLFSGKPQSLILIVVFEDGRLMIHDGTHRCLSAVLAGRRFLLEPEYKVENWSYTQYKNINFNNNWITPFDPLEELRIADLSSFKNKVYELKSLEEKRNFILNNKHEYCVKRNLFDVVDFSRKFKDGLL